MPNNTGNPIVRTNILPLQLLVYRPCRSISILAQRIDLQKARLAWVVLGIFLVTPVAGEIEPIDRIPTSSFRIGQQKVQGGRWLYSEL
jgi:hypothetical protein